jgi:hypothetical protein
MDVQRLVLVLAVELLIGAAVFRKEFTPRADGKPHSVWHWVLVILAFATLTVLWTVWGYATCEGGSLSPRNAGSSLKGPRAAIRSARASTGGAGARLAFAFSKLWIRSRFITAALHFTASGGHRFDLGLGGATDTEQ